MEEWDPEKEKDPEKLQAEMLDMGKKMLEQFKADQKQREQQDAAYQAAGPPIAAFSYKPPTFAEVSSRLKRAWDETRKIAPDADGFVQTELLRTLFQAAMQEDRPTT